jgi:sigma-B regulation protein RsbU (phosphoserine phosphatase)
MSSVATNAARILIADDQTDILHALQLLLSEAGFQTELVTTVNAVVRALADRPADLLLMDLNYQRDTTSGREGLDLVTRVHRQHPALPIVVMTGWGSIETAVEAMRRGARSFVQKPWENAVLVDILRREVAEARAARRTDHRQAREEEEALAIQRALLPQELPTMPGCALAASCLPASGLGGDCYDIVRFADSIFAVSIADVIGKGLPAALLMSNLQAAVRAYASSRPTPRTLVENVNRLLCHNVRSGKFVTFCYALFDLSARVVTFANAGHNPPFVLRADGTIEMLRCGGMVLGVMPDGAYSQGQIDIQHGDRYVFYTDGMTEARDERGDEFGEERLIEAVRGVRHLDASALETHLRTTVHAFAGETLEDDATLIVVAVD